MGYDNTNRGSFWKNPDKETDKHPDFKGSLNVEGKEYWIAGWKRKEGANPNAPALSFTCQEKEQQNQAPPPQPQPSQTQETFKDDIPF